MKKKVTINLVKKEVSKVFNEKIDDTSEGFKTGVILLSSAVVGPNIKKIASFTGYPRKDVQKRALKCREQKIWVGGKIACEWFEKDGGIALACDCLCVDGLLERTAKSK